MDYRFARRIEALRRMCPSDWMVYVVTPGEEPGVAPKDEIAKTDIILGSVGDDVATLYHRYWEVCNNGKR